MYPVRRFVAAFVAALALCATAHAQSYKDALSTVPPIGPGPYPVGCSNVEQDLSRVAPGSDATAYWEGRGGGGSGYVTSLLVDPAHAFVFDVTLPDDDELYGDFRNQTLTFAALVCYPTTPGNPRAAYPLPNGKAVPHMQRDGDAPIFATDRPRFPALLFSTGLGGSPLSGDYLDALTLFASQGYVVIAPFHADARISDINLQTLNDVVNAALHFSNYTALQSVRPQALRASLDAVLADPQYAAGIDASEIGGFGASLGGESLLLMRGARLTDSIGLSSSAVMNDTRLKAAVGYVPYFGQLILPAFGRDQEGLSDVQMPYLAITGSADVTAPAVVTAVGMTKLTGARQLVLLEGVTHSFDIPSTPDIFTWSLTFLDAYVQDDPLARATSARMTNVAGGGNDILLLDRAVPLPPGPGEQTAIEYYNASLDHYFITSDPVEIAILDAGQQIPGWQRTGYAFNVYALGAAQGVAACRFFGVPGVGPNTHFYTILPNECDDVKRNPLWIFEGLVFKVQGPDAAGNCPADRVPVVRMYNNGKGGQANHRYLTSRNETTEMGVEGWVLEGVVFCAPP
jgi:predicted dienelactone hydrolase